MRRELNDVLEQIETDLSAVEVGLGELKTGYANLRVRMDAMAEELERLKRGLGETTASSIHQTKTVEAVRSVLRDAIQRAMEKRLKPVRYWKVVDLGTGEVIGGVEADSHAAASSVFRKALPPRIQWAVVEVSREEYAEVRKDAYEIDVVM